MRTENDTWDIKTSVGSTALFVAAARALEAQKPDPAAVDPYAEVFCRAVGRRLGRLVDGKAPEHTLKTEFGEYFVDFQGVRTRYFDTYFQAAAAAGVRQVVLLAAGLDSRGYRLDWPDGTVVFELDQPAVLEFKREVLEQHGAAPTAERREIAVDLRNDWPQALRDTVSTRPSRRRGSPRACSSTCPEAAQQQLFTGIDALAAPGSHVAVEEAVPMDAAAFEAAREQERASGERGHLLHPRLQRAARTRRASSLATAAGAPRPHHCRITCVAFGRPVPAPDTDAGSMTSTISLVSATKG